MTVVGLFIAKCYVMCDEYGECGELVSCHSVAFFALPACGSALLLRFYLRKTMLLMLLTLRTSRCLCRSTCLRPAYPESENAVPVSRSCYIMC